MNYTIASESRHRIRVNISSRKITQEQAKILQYAFSGIPGVTKVTVYRATGDCAIMYDCDRTDIIRRLNKFNFGNVQMLAEKEDAAKAKISSDEMKRRKLDPELKRKLRLRIMGEALADAVLPLPVQLAYHAYQMVTLKEL